MFWLQLAVEQSSGLEKSRNEQLLAKAMEVRDWDSPTIALLEQIERRMQQGRFARLAETPHKLGKPFEALSSPAGILVGLNCKIGEYGGPAVVQAIQPIYLTKLGERAGEWHGASTWGAGDPIKIRARPGYAISGLSVQQTEVIDNIQVTFARVGRVGLDPRRTYRSPVVGQDQKSQANQTLLMSNTQPIIGLFGYADSWVGGFGVIVPK